MTEATETEETEELKIMNQITKVITGFDLDIQKAINADYALDDPESIDNYLTEVTFEIGYNDDPLKVLVVSGELEVVITLGQLNRSQYHITKSSAKEEIERWRDSAICRQADTDEWVVKSEENVKFYEVLSTLDHLVNNAGWETRETRDKVLAIIWKDQARISDNYEGQLP